MTDSNAALEQETEMGKGGEGGVEREGDNDTIMITVPASSSSWSRTASPRESPSPGKPGSKSTTAATAAKTTRKEPLSPSQSQCPSSPKAGDISPLHNSPNSDRNDAEEEEEEAEVEAEFVSARKKYDVLSAQKYELLLQIARLEGNAELEVLWNEVERREYVVSAMRNKVRGLERGSRDR
jgi:hypothetical protein